MALYWDRKSSMLDREVEREMQVPNPNRVTHGAYADWAARHGLKAAVVGVVSIGGALSYGLWGIGGVTPFCAAVQAIWVVGQVCAQKR